MKNITGNKRGTFIHPFTLVKSIFTKTRLFLRHPGFKFEFNRNKSMNDLIAQNYQFENTSANQRQKGYVKPTWVHWRRTNACYRQLYYFWSQKMDWQLKYCNTEFCNPPRAETLFLKNWLWSHIVTFDDWFIQFFFIRIVWNKLSL